MNFWDKVPHCSRTHQKGLEANYWDPLALSSTVLGVQVCRGTTQAGIHFHIGSRNWARIIAFHRKQPTGLFSFLYYLIFSFSPQLFEKIKEHNVQSVLVILWLVFSVWNNMTVHTFISEVGTRVYGQVNCAVTTVTHLALGFTVLKWSSYDS